MPAILVGDIDLGRRLRIAWPEPSHSCRAAQRDLVRGFVINKFRGDPVLLGDGLATNIERRCGVPTLGVHTHDR